MEIVERIAEESFVLWVFLTTPDIAIKYKSILGYQTKLGKVWVKNFVQDFKLTESGNI